MDTNQTYRAIVKNIISKYAQLRPSHGQIRLEAIIDERHDRYALMQTGWDGHRRIRGNLLYLTLVNGQIIVEYDGLEQGVWTDLVEAGVAPEDIVLAYLPDMALA